MSGMKHEPIDRVRTKIKEEPLTVGGMGVNNKPAKPMGSNGWLSRPKTRRGIKIALFLAPILIFSLLFVYYPFVKTIINSFCTVNQKGHITGFAGLENYKYVFGRSDFKKAVVNSLILTGINVPVTLIITLTLALIANKRRRLSPVYETLFALPMAVSMSAACMVFKSMFSPTLGIVNAMLGTNLGWFESRSTALYTIIILTVWMGIGFNFLLFLSALRAIPSEVMEAARLDGAGFFATLFKVQLPLISPTILYVACTNLVLAMMCSAPMIIITQGGPSRSTTSLMYLMFASGYGSSNYSLAAVVSIVTFLLTFGFTVATFLLERKKVHYQ